ncbi:MAG TPA: hypothetical protein VK820_09290 [Steroidobacteraceae bacterium]|jgi:hypothetical protein|nr:hypothetical protein [Steroidobacteraceae bacterium]
MHLDVEAPRSVAEIAEKLRRLPAQSTPPLRWKEFKRRQLLRRARAQAAQRRQLSVVAAVALAIVGVIALWGHLPPLQNSLTQRLPVASLPNARHPVPLAWDEAPMARHSVPLAWDEAAAHSLIAERWLAAQPAEPVIVRVGTRAAVMHLEDRIAWVDDTLTSVRARGGEADRARALQYERDRLISSLAQVRYAETLAADLP